MDKEFMKQIIQRSAAGGRSEPSAAPPSSVPQEKEAAPSAPSPVSKKAEKRAASPAASHPIAKKKKGEEAVKAPIKVKSVPEPTKEAPKKSARGKAVVEEEQEEDVLMIPVGKDGKVADPKIARIYLDNMFSAADSADYKQIEQGKGNMIPSMASYVLKSLVVAKGIDGKLRSLVKTVGEQNKEIEAFPEKMDKAIENARRESKEELAKASLEVAVAKESAKKAQSEAEAAKGNAEAYLKKASQAVKSRDKALADAGIFKKRAEAAEAELKHAKEGWAAEVDAACQKAVAEFKKSQEMTDMLVNQCVPVFNAAVTEYRKEVLIAHPGLDLSKVDKIFPAALPGKTPAQSAPASPSATGDQAPPTPSAEGQAAEGQAHPAEGQVAQSAAIEEHDLQAVAATEAADVQIIED